MPLADIALAQSRNLTAQDLASMALSEDREARLAAKRGDSDIAGEHALERDRLLNQYDSRWK